MNERVDILVSQRLQKIAKMIEAELEAIPSDERLAFTLFVWTKPEAVFVGNQSDGLAMARGILEIAEKIAEGNPIVPTHEKH